MSKLIGYDALGQGLHVGDFVECATEGCDCGLYGTVSSDQGGPTINIAGAAFVRIELIEPSKLAYTSVIPSGIKKVKKRELTPSETTVDLNAILKEI